MTKTQYADETMIMLRSEPIPMYPEYGMYNGLYKHMEASDGKFYVWSENVVGGPRHRLKEHNESYVSIVPAGMEYKGWVCAHVWVDGNLYHMISVGLVFDV